MTVPILNHGNGHGSIRELVKQAPAAVALILVFVLFLRFERDRLETLKDISQECHSTTITITQSMADALEKTTEASKENTAALVRVALLLERVESRLERGQGGSR